MIKNVLINSVDELSEKLEHMKSIRCYEISSEDRVTDYPPLYVSKNEVKFSKRHDFVLQQKLTVVIKTNNSSFLTPHCVMDVLI